MSVEELHIMAKAESTSESRTVRCPGNGRIERFYNSVIREEQGCPGVGYEGHRTTDFFPATNRIASNGELPEGAAQPPRQRVIRQLAGVLFGIDKAKVVFAWAVVAKKSCEDNFGQGRSNLLHERVTYARTASITDSKTKADNTVLRTSGERR